MKGSLEWLAEEYFVQLYRQHPALKGKTIVHYDEDREAQSNCVVVHATVGQHHNAEEASRDAQVPPVLRDRFGVKTDAFEVTVEVAYRTPQKATVTQNNLVNDALGAAIFQADRNTTTAEREFGYLLIMDGLSGNREHTQSLRKITKTFSILAKLIGEPVNALAY